MLVPVILLFLQAQYWHSEAGVAKPMLPTKNAKIFGGHDIDITEAPYQVSIHHSGYFTKGGVLVKNDIVLTSAESLFAGSINPSHYKVRVGSSIIDEGGILHEVEKIVVHPLHKARTYNLAVFKLSTPVTFSDKVAAIPMMEPGEEVPDGENVQVTGWGWISYPPIEDPIMLQKLEVQTVNYDTCVYKYDPSVIIPNMMCAGDASGHKGFYFGDYGSPLVFNGKLAGLSNYWSQYFEIQAYSKVSAFRSWIDGTIQNITTHF